MRYTRDAWQPDYDLAESSKQRITNNGRSGRGLLLLNQQSALVYKHCD